MRISHGVGVEAARAATGVVVVIDVLRAFTVSAYALAGGARECLLVPTVDGARALAAATPRSVLSAEVDGLPVPGIEISNSPTMVSRSDLAGRVLVQRSSAGVPVINAVPQTARTYAGSLVVASATAQACLLRRPDEVTIVCSADFLEDRACARYLEALLLGESPPPGEVDALLKPLYESDRYRELARGDWPGFPTSDLELSLRPDRFDFAMLATRTTDHVRLTAERPQTVTHR